MPDLSEIVQREHVTDAYEGTLPADRLLWVDTLIGRATRLLSSPGHRPGLQAWLATGQVDPLDVRDVVVSAVLRVIRNPEGIYREQEADYGYSKSVEVASGVLAFTDAELARVTPVSTVRRRSLSIVTR